MKRQHMDAAGYRYAAAEAQSSAKWFWRFAALEAGLVVGMMALAEFAPTPTPVSPLLPLSAAVMIGEASWQTRQAKRYAAKALGA